MSTSELSISVYSLSPGREKLSHPREGPQFSSSQMLSSSQFLHCTGVIYFRPKFGRDVGLGLGIDPLVGSLFLKETKQELCHDSSVVQTL